MGISVTGDNGIAGGGKTAGLPQPYRTFRQVIGMFVPPYEHIPMLPPKMKYGYGSRRPDDLIGHGLEIRLCPLANQGRLV